MDIEEVHILDPELLQLPGLSVKSNPLIAEELFSHWLSLPDTSRLVLFPFSSPLLVTCLSIFI